MGYSWEQVKDAVNGLGVDPGDLILAGSAPLVAHGVLPAVGDIDVVALPPAWEALALRTEPRPGELGDHIIDLPGDIQVFSGWRGQPAIEVAPAAELTDGWQLLPLEDVIAYKHQLRRPKDLDHLAALAEWSREQSGLDGSPRLLVDRADAGRRLAPLVATLDLRDPVVLGLPRGGVPVAARVAQALDCPLDVLLVRKLGVPGNREYAFGAIGEGGVRVVDHAIADRVGLSQEDVAQVASREVLELARRSATYRPHRTPVDLTGATAVIVDDGAATGSTARAAVAVARRLGAAQVVVAVGACPPEVVRAFESEADHVVAALVAEPFMAVGQWYRHFGQTSDAEVLTLLGLS